MDLDEQTFVFEHRHPRRWLVPLASMLWMLVLLLFLGVLAFTIPYLTAPREIVDCSQTPRVCEAELPDWFSQLPSREDFPGRYLAARRALLGTRYFALGSDTYGFMNASRAELQSPGWWMDELERASRWPRLDQGGVSPGEARELKEEAAAYIRAKSAYRRRAFREIETTTARRHTDWDAHHGEGIWLLALGLLMVLGSAFGVGFAVRWARRHAEERRTLHVVLGRHRYQMADREGLYEDLDDNAASMLVFQVANHGHSGDISGLGVALRARVRASRHGDAPSDLDRVRLQALKGGESSSEPTP